MKSRNNSEQVFGIYERFIGQLNTLVMKGAEAVVLIGGIRESAGEIRA